MIDMPVDRYRPMELLGRGGMGQVWRAWDEILDRPVAVKTLHADYAEQPEFRQRLRTEARLAARLNHPSLATVFDYGDGSGGVAPYVVMELVEGRTLSEVLAEENGPLAPDRVARVIADAAEALAAAHATGVIHRDVKSSNIMLCPNGQVKITDFGIAHAIGAPRHTATGETFGSPPYMSPEHAGAGPIEPASDVYSLGVVAYELLCGSRPFQGEPIAVALAHRETPPPPVPATVPAGLAVLVGAMLAKDPGERPAMAAVARRATPHTIPVGDEPDELPSSVEAVLGAAPARLYRAGRRTLAATAGLLCLLAILVVGGAVLVNSLLGAGEGTSSPEPVASTPGAGTDPATPSPDPGRAGRTADAAARVAASTANPAPGPRRATPPPRTTAPPTAGQPRIRQPGTGGHAAHPPARGPRATTKHQSAPKRAGPPTKPAGPHGGGPPQHAGAQGHGPPSQAHRNGHGPPR